MRTGRKRRCDRSSGTGKAKGENDNEQIKFDERCAGMSGDRM